ncbi:L-carnitine dehydratase/bile acid-inducible protein F [Desulfobulbus propionicus DSM 2032]|uniref:L-carnitine dehydratase/bile acid-inducible protein F n=1 Tax=Desulfobulbus propionicus (strain ATCC 33891 / DSM 2032 / VKM B-1956 / 1pr3) TaxID=577650 RepID=A0A7U3YNJ7_DESPD|nr:CaiB/BaiF CoA-transferase family protein [Desulfobulbus propionicus]ADW18658.1 L-carnitine dehydratase/bile acid-inducible protein F [Desulfobulbus propionicus DSM 2032]
MDSEQHEQAATPSLPLRGIRVLELGHNIMGPACGLILADLGADVYKIERPGKGDDTRWLQGFGAGFFTCFNRNKKSLAIDLKRDQGRDLFLRLVEQVDVLIENFAPGTVDRLGIGAEICRQRNPRLVFCSLKGFMPGPYAHRLALDEVVQMMGGLAYMTGPSGKPMRAGASVTDILSGSFGVIGILAALLERQQSGQGKVVQATLFESVAFLMGQHMAGAGVSGQVPPPMPERGRAWSVYELFTTRDGLQVFIGITSDRHWRRFCTTFGFADWAEDPRLATNQGRIEARSWFFPELQNRLHMLTREELTTLAERAGIPFAPVCQPVDLWNDPHMNQSGGLAVTETPSGKEVKLPKLPLRLDGHSFDLRLQPPAVGEGGGDLLVQAGIGEEEIVALEAAGIVAARSCRRR